MSVVKQLLYWMASGPKQSMKGIVERAYLSVSLISYKGRMKRSGAMEWCWGGGGGAMEWCGEGEEGQWSGVGRGRRGQWSGVGRGGIELT